MKPQTNTAYAAAVEERIRDMRFSVINNETDGVCVSKVVGNVTVSTPMYVWDANEKHDASLTFLAGIEAGLELASAIGAIYKGDPNVK